MHDKIHKPKQKTRDFDTELVNQVVRILLSNNTELTGFLLDATRFWLKVKTKEKVVYINKAHVVLVEVQK